MQRLPSIAACAITFLSLVSPALAQQPPAPTTTQVPTTTLERIRAAGSIRLGYRADARPFSFRDGSAAAGYSVALCNEVVGALRAQLGLPALSAQWVEVTLADRFQAVQQGRVDLVCDAATVTVERRQDVSFSVPIFPGGISALVRTDAPSRLRDVLNETPRTDPVWRGSAGQLLTQQTFSVVSGTTAEPWLTGRLDDLTLSAVVVPVATYEAGIQAVVDRGAHVFFGDRAILLDAAARHPSADDLMVLERLFTYEPVALVLPKGDDDFRLAVDRGLIAFYARNGYVDFVNVYLEWFGEIDENARTFFRWIAPE